jgi:uncharacterized protein YhdP
MQFDVTSNLAGLVVQAPEPFAKGPAETRATRVRLELPGARMNDVTLESGSARAKLRFAVRDGLWRLDRGAARFDGQAVGLPAQPGLLVTGDWPQFDLGQWLALSSTTAGNGNAAAAGGQRLMDWLGPVDVHLDRATVFGFEFTDVIAKLRSDGSTWRVGVTGPQAEGQVSVPDDLTQGRPIVLEMQRLQLVDVQSDGNAANAARTQVDPRTLPAIVAHAADFTWQGRRFGQLAATISREPRGLTIDSIATTAPAFEIQAKGSWWMEQGAPRTRVNLLFTSTDFGAAARSLAYRDAIDAKKARIAADLWWPGGPSADVFKTLNGTLKVHLQDGRLRDIEPGAGRMLGLLSVAQLPRRLALDFRDVTDEGLAFNSVRAPPSTWASSAAPASPPRITTRPSS